MFGKLRKTHSFWCVMLVVSRKPRERIFIAGGIVITVCEIVGNRCRIGIEAPPEIRVMREEIAESRDGLSCARGNGSGANAYIPKSVAKST